MIGRRDLLLAGAATALGLGVAAPPARSADRIRVVTSITILQDMVRNVGGDRVEVATLVGPNGDAHVFQPTPGDAQAIAHAGLVVINGLGLEGWMPRLIAAAGFGGPVVVAATGIDTLQGEAEGGGSGPVPDPHGWQDLRNGQIYVANIVAGLGRVDPENAGVYAERGAAYGRALGELDARVRADLAALPAEKRRVITTHDAFQYYGRAYGVEFIAPVGVSTESEASAGDVARLIRQVRQQQVKALFLENVSDPRLIREIAHDTGAVVGPPLYSDALSRPDEPAATYLEMVAYNTRTLIEGMRRN